jgi:hypothetical protein
VAAVEDHALKKYPVFGAFFVPSHLAQYRWP